MTRTTLRKLTLQFSLETLTFCSALSIVSFTYQRLYRDYISTEHINHRVLAPLLASDGFKRLDRVICRIA